MRAIVCRQYGPPEVALRSEDVEKPAPGDHEVLIRVRAAAVNPLDWHLMKGRPHGFRLLTGLTRPIEVQLRCRERKALTPVLPQAPPLLVIRGLPRRHFVALR